MKNKWGLAWQLGWQLILLLFVVFGVAVYWVQSSISQFSDMVQNELVQQQAGELVQHLTFDHKGLPHIDLPPDLITRYHTAEHGWMYLLANSSGHIIEMSVPQAAERLEKGLGELSEESHFDSEDEDGVHNAIYGMVREISGPDGKSQFYLLVGQNRGTDQSLLEGASDKTIVSMLEFLIPLFALGVLLVTLTIYNGFRPIRRLSAQTRQLGPGNLRLRLEEGIAPAEVQPIVTAVNQLLNRLELSFAEQRHFIADTAHQLRTPLAVMQARLDHLSEFKGKLMFEKDIQRMGRLIQQLLSLAQLEAQQLKLEKTNLVKLVREATEHLVPLALNKKVKLTFDTPAKLILIQADATRLPEVLQNIIENAINHSPAGKRVEVHVTNAGQVQVADRGKGINASRKPLLFQRFWQADGRGSGVGLGLAIVAEIMRQHGGSVQVEERPGGGSVFVLGFQLAE